MESKILGFALRNTTLGIRSPLTIGIRNPVLGIENPRMWNLEYKTVLESLCDLSWQHVSTKSCADRSGEFMCVDIVDKRANSCLYHGLSRKCFCYRQLYRWPRVKQYGSGRLTAVNNRPFSSSKSLTFKTKLSGKSFH